MKELLLIQHMLRFVSMTWLMYIEKSIFALITAVEVLRMGGAGVGATGTGDLHVCLAFITPSRLASIDVNKTLSQ